MATPGVKAKTARNSRKRAAKASPWSGWRLPGSTPADVAEAFAAVKAQAEAFGTRDRISPLMVLAAAREMTTIARMQVMAEKDGEVLPTNNGMVMTHPAVAIRSQAEGRLRRLFNDFGFSAASSKLAAPAPAEDGDNHWNGMIGVVG